MRETLRETSSAPETGYDQLLRESIGLQRQIEASNRTGPPSAMSAEERRDALRRVNDLLRRRVASLRNTDGLQTIEDAFPRVRTVEDEGRQRDVQAILHAYVTGAIEQPHVVAVASEPLSASHDLTDDEWKAFCVARGAVARNNGYQAGYEDDATAPQESNWFVIRKGNLTFELQHFAFASGPAVLGRSRIAFLRVTSGAGSALTEHMAFDRTWMTLCTDPAIQSEIDRVVAIFA